MQQSGREGQVDITCDVDTNGSTSNCTVTSATGGTAFAEAALAYVQQCRYKPAVRNGVPVKEPHHTFHIIFTLRE
jgi:protein TonB